ncbi:MAG: gephyrin-like molybdotransferase Glp [Bacteroidota bacterium]
MIDVEEAKSLINQHTTTLSSIKVSLPEACGHVLARPVFAFCNIPVFRQSSMDGYAIKFRDVNKDLILKGEMPAGAMRSFEIYNGECARIFTGAPIPDGADTVVMQEKVQVSNTTVRIDDPNLVFGANVREIGAEIKSGSLAMDLGSYLSPPAIGFLAGIGINEVEVYKFPKLSIIITGRELQKPGMTLNFGQVYDSNSYSLTAALKQEGIKQISVVSADDDLLILTNILRDQLLNYDVILLTGGVSVGDYDFVLKATEAFGIDKIFHKVKQKPGKPLYFGKHGTKLVFGLPGNPSSVLSCYYNYVLPALRLLSGKDVPENKEARLASAYSKPAGLTQFLKGHFSGGIVSPLDAQESFRLSSFAQSNCLVSLPEHQQHFEAGDLVEIILIPD